MKTYLRFVTFLLCLFFFSISLSAQIPNIISFQGILTDSEGNNLPDGFYQVDFAIFDAPTDGNLWWTESQSVNIEGGLANVMLGVNTPLDIPFDKMYFVEMNVGGETLSPRVPMTASPYSLSAANVTLKNLNLNNNNPEGGSISNSANTRTNIYSNNNAFDSPAWIEAWGDNTGDLSRTGELTLSGKYLSFWVKSSSSAFGQGQMFLTPEGRLGLGTWPGLLMHARGSDTTEAVLLLEPHKWDSEDDLAEIWLGTMDSRIVSRFGNQLYFHDSEGYVFDGQGTTDFVGSIRANQGIEANGFLGTSGPDGSFRVTPFFGAGDGTTLIGAYTGFNGNGPQLRFALEEAGTDYFDIGMNGSNEFVVEVSDAQKFVVRQDGAQLFGNLNLTGAVIDGSSRAFKNNISSLSANQAIETIMALNPVTYNYKAEKEQDLHVGFIAEDVPELLSIPSRQGISSMDVTATLTKVVQEQQKMIQALQQELELLKNEIKSLRDEKE